MILLTGATGLLGHYLVEELKKRGEPLRALVRDASARGISFGEGVEVIEGDVLDVLALEKAMQGVTRVIHAAGLVSFHRQDRSRLMQVNGEGTYNVVNACLDAEVERLVHVSSVAAIGMELEGKVATEASPWQASQNQSNYARSKRRAELEVYRGIAEGLSACMVNPGVILGYAGNWDQSSAELFATAAKGIRFYIDGMTSLVGGEDVAQAIRLLLENDAPDGERYILVAENWSTHQLFGKITQLVGKRPPSIKVPGWAIKSLAWLAERMVGKRSPLAVEAIEGGLSTQRYDGSKIEALGLVYTPIEEVLSDLTQKWEETHP